MFPGRLFGMLAVLISLVSATSGCAPAEKGVKVTGSVTKGGQPQDGARVSFIPADPKPEGSRGALTGADGKFEVKLEPGKYKVILSRLVDASGKVPSESEDPAQLEASGLLRQSIPPQYSDPASTTLSVEIPPEGKDLPAFEVAG
jgi:hypothetical protein